jgi:hypothetical protein
MGTLVAGIDDVATQTRSIAGWAYFLLPEIESTAWRLETRLLLRRYCLRRFHAKDFNPSAQAPFLEFLKRIREYRERDDTSRIACSFNTPRWNNAALKFADDVTPKILRRFQARSTDFQKTAKALFPPLRALQKLTAAFPLHVKLRVEIDEDSRIKILGSRTVVVQGKTISDEQFLEKVYQAYRKAFFPNCPLLVKNGISVLKDSKSPMIQAADVVGNFMASYIYMKLGDKNQDRTLKGKMFERVFGDALSGKQFHENLKIAGQHDLELIKGLAYQIAI